MICIPRRFSLNEFISKARMIHGDRYNYDDVLYVNMHTKVKIRCNLCGTVFEQAPNNHLSGCGCPVCSRSRPLIVDICDCVNRDKTDWFIQQAQLVHGIKYDYSKSNYIGSHCGIVIGCKEHGWFVQKASAHLRGCGCPICGRERGRFSCMPRSMSTEDFIVKARMVHGDVYDYSKSICLGSKKYVDIVCNTCGRTFQQVVYSHLQGRGCPYCGALLRGKHASSTKVLRGTMNTSKPEEIMYDRLCQLFGTCNVHRHFNKNAEYPFHCDFYVADGVHKYYIELNAHWTHGKHWYGSENKDLAVLEKWLCKAVDSKIYSAAVNTWTVRDVRKRLFAKSGELNYIVFWDWKLQDFEEWVSLGCPDGQDWDHEYSWKD